jgi:uncharacterized protein (DUF2252 family)
MAVSTPKSVEDRSGYGESLRKQTPRDSHGDWSPAIDRPNPVDLLEAQNKDRLPWLIPVRRARMSASPFAFFRGSARIMASDLASMPVTGLQVQVCGDAHLANFGFFASPERHLVFDINDFDETLPGPWEWDIKRLAASFTIAARHNGLGKGDRRKVTEMVVRAYREAMSDFAAMRTMDIWHALLDEDQCLKIADEEGRENQLEKISKQAITRDSRQALDKLAEETEGEYRIKSDPPGLVPIRELRGELELQGRNLEALTRHAFDAYKGSVRDHDKMLLERFHPVDIALKVVGVGSVGTRCAVMLLQGRDRKDPLFLQLKQATRSVLEEHLPRSQYKNHGQRVVEGQRLMQTVSDVALGWTTGLSDDNHYYWRQLRDWKGSADVENLSIGDLRYMARLCGWTLARAHARSGDAIAIAGYLGTSDKFDKALVDFAALYADQNERDYAAFVEEIHSGRLAADEG